MRWLTVLSTVLVLSSGNAIRADAASTTNFTDQWWNPNESGWGAAGTQQGDTIFFNVFVFDDDRKQTSFTSAAVYQDTTAQGHLIFSGDLYLVSGPQFGGLFNPATVSSRKVGTLTFDADSVDTALLSYSVDGVMVAKNVTRQLWRYENLTGNYYGGLIGTYYACSDPAFNGPWENLAAFNVNYAPNNTFTMSFNGIDGSVCNFSGTYTQAGHMVTVRGNYTCSGAVVGTFILFELEKSISGLTGRVVGQNSIGNTACQFDGHIGGVLR